MLAQAPAPDDIARELSGIREEVADLKVSVGELKSKLQFYEQELSTRTAPGRVEFDPAKTGEVRFLSSKGVLFAVVLDSYTPDSGGMRVRLQVAPLNSFIVTQMDINVDWAKTKASEDRKSYNTTNLRILHPDRWNVVDLLLPGALPVDLGYVTLSLTPQSIRPPQR